MSTETTVTEVPSVANNENILNLVDATLTNHGVVGEANLKKLLYLAITSRFLDKPVSVVVKGPSSCGKSFVLENVIKLFPESAYVKLTSMSHKLLAHTTKSLEHKHIWINEAAGLPPEAEYLLRSLLSEGEIRYSFVEASKNGIAPRENVIKGPTGLLLTTTRNWLNKENETRMLSVQIDDSPEQNAAVIEAGCIDWPNMDVAPWVEYQEWLVGQNHRAVIPFSRKIVTFINSPVNRMKRDMNSLWRLIKTSAIIHQAHRSIDDQGNIVATLDDYEMVRDLIENIISEGSSASVNPGVIGVVHAVAELNRTVSIREIAEHLRCDKSAVSRHVASAISDGYLINDNLRRGGAYQIKLGAPLPESANILPTKDQLLTETVEVEQEF
jgi:hypothetical protein